MLEAKVLEFIYNRAAEKTLRQTILTPQDLPGLPKGTLAVRTEDGLEIRNVPLAAPEHIATDIKTMFAVALQYSIHEGEGDGPIDSRCQIWHAGHLIKLIFDYEKAGEIYLAYSISEPFRMLANWHKNGSVVYSQLEFIQVLRTTLAKCCGNHPDLLGIVRHVNTKTSEEEMSNRQRSKVSVSKSLVMEATGLERIPEVLSFRVPIYDEREFTATIDVACEFNQQLDKFVLNVLPGEIVRAQRGSDDSIAKEIAAVQKELATSIPVYHGNR